VARLGDELLIEGTIGSFAALHISVEELNDVIEEHGVGCEWRRAVRCPCQRIETHRPRSGCPVCNGLGYAYPESRRSPIIALVLNRQPNRRLLQVGEYVTGQVTITMPTPHVMAQGDIVMPDNEVHVVHQTFWRAQQQIDNRELMASRTTPDQAPPKMLPDAEVLRYPEIAELEHIHWIDEKGKLCEASGADFRLVGNRIDWKKRRGPPAGEAYTVRYKAPAAYQLQPAEPVVRMEGSSVFPYRAVAYRLDQIGDPDFR